MACMTQLADLLEDCARGDQGAFERLYRHTSGTMFAIALRIVNDRTLAGDVLQEGYLKVWNRADSFDPTQANPVTWIGAIIRHQAIDTLRRRGCRPCCQEEEPELDRLTCHNPGPQELTDRDHRSRQLRACLDRLPEHQRRVLTLAYFHGMTHEELARHLDVPLGTCKSWVRKGLQQLKVMMEDPPSVPAAEAPARPAFLAAGAMADFAPSALGALASA